MGRSKNDFPSTIVIGLFLFGLIIDYAHGNFDFSDLPPGPYCAGRYPKLHCCDGRQDDCSAPILDTLCYCDDFCNRTEMDQDCCPDYWSHCTNTTVAQPVERGCDFKGSYYHHGESVMDNCNKCKCSTMGKESEMLCEFNRCLVEPELIESVNIERDQLGWRAGNYSKFWGRTLTEGIQLRLGTLNPSKSVTGMNPVRRIYNPNDFPKYFESEDKWRGFISGIKDQGWCGASWALSTVDVASDRFAIMSKGRETVELAAQNLLSCNKRGQQGCKGGYLDKAWLYVRKNGLVDEDCYPWTGDQGTCKIPKRANLLSAGCKVPSFSPRTELYKVGPTYRLGNETDIMHEIMRSGPVQATMKVYQDFFSYKSGIYKHSVLAELHDTGYHSVRITGWGEETSFDGSIVKYWIVANSWGVDWGEKGYFRIVRGINECDIETFVLGVWAKTAMKNRHNSINI